MSCATSTRRCGAYVHESGVGPWEIHELNPDNVADMVGDCRPAECEFRLAVTMVGSVQRKLIQPLDDRSMYAEFLNTKSEGLHHVAVGVRDYRETLDTLTAEAYRVLQGGLYKGRRSPTCRPRGGEGGPPAGGQHELKVHERTSRPSGTPYQALILSRTGASRRLRRRRER